MLLNAPHVVGTSARNNERARALARSGAPHASQSLRVSGTAFLPERASARKRDALTCANAGAMSRLRARCLRFLRASTSRRRSRRRSASSSASGWQARPHAHHTDAASGASSRCPCFAHSNERHPPLTTNDDMRGQDSPHRPGTRGYVLGSPQLREPALSVEPLRRERCKLRCRTDQRITRAQGRDTPSR
jgi:hypothetical protein